MQQRQRRHEDGTRIATAPGVTVELTLAPRNRKEKMGEPPSRRVSGSCPGRVPRVARLMAMAIKFQDMIERREIHDYADLARLGYVSRARVTQIMNLLNLAPNIQEEILFLRPAFGRGPVTERHFRRLNAIIDWCEQRRLWRDLKAREVPVHLQPIQTPSPIPSSESCTNKADHCRTTPKEIRMQRPVNSRNRDGEVGVHLLSSFS